MTTRGELIQQWRRQAGLNRAEVGRLVNTSRQNIDNLENDRVSGVPGYLPALARAMGYENTDDLLALKPLPASGSVAAPHQLANRLDVVDAKAPIGPVCSRNSEPVAQRILRGLVARKQICLSRTNSFAIVSPSTPRGRNANRIRLGRSLQAGWRMWLADAPACSSTRPHRAPKQSTH